MFLSLYNRSLVNTWGFVPMSPDEIRHLADGLRMIICPEMAVAAEIDGRVVGATLRPARLQPAHQGHQGPAVSLRLHPPASQPPGHQAHPPDQHERACPNISGSASGWF